MKIVFNLVGPPAVGKTTLTNLASKNFEVARENLAGKFFESLDDYALPTSNHSLYIESEIARQVFEITNAGMKATFLKSNKKGIAIVDGHLFNAIIHNEVCAHAGQHNPLMRKKLRSLIKQYLAIQKDSFDGLNVTQVLILLKRKPDDILESMKERGRVIEGSAEFENPKYRYWVKDYYGMFEVITSDNNIAIEVLEMDNKTPEQTLFALKKIIKKYTEKGGV